MDSNPQLLDSKMTTHSDTISSLFPRLMGSKCSFSKGHCTSTLHFIQMLIEGNAFDLLLKVATFTPNPMEKQGCT